MRKLLMPSMSLLMGKWLYETFLVKFPCALSEPPKLLFTKAGYSRHMDPSIAWQALQTSFALHITARQALCGNLSLSDNLRFVKGSDDSRQRSEFQEKRTLQLERDEEELLSLYKTSLCKNNPTTIVEKYATSRNNPSMFFCV